MKDLLLTLLHLAVMTATLCGQGGVRAVIAENLLLKQQLIVLRRARQRARDLHDPREWMARLTDRRHLRTAQSRRSSH
jgi:shikimate 5-dehydrogenase